MNNSSLRSLEPGITRNQQNNQQHYCPIPGKEKLELLSSETLHCTLRYHIPPVSTNALMGPTPKPWPQRAKVILQQLHGCCFAGNLNSIHFAQIHATRLNSPMVCPRHSYENMTTKRNSRLHSEREHFPCIYHHRIGGLAQSRHTINIQWINEKWLILEAGFFKFKFANPGLYDGVSGHTEINVR